MVELLSTKFFIPPLRPNQLPRPRLIQLLQDGLRAKRKLTLVSAPAGFGKTTLVVGGLEKIDLPAIEKALPALLNEITLQIDPPFLALDDVHPLTVNRKDNANHN